MKNEIMVGIGAALMLCSPMLFGSIPWPIVVIMVLVGLLIVDRFTMED